MKTLRLVNGYWLLLILAIIGLDQVSKYLAMKHLMLYQPLYIMEILNFTLAHNTGAAFSLLASASGWQWSLLTLFAIVASLVVLWCLFTLPAGRCWTAIALSLIGGGAIGNLIDRLHYGYVIDFIDVHWQQYHWAIFNIADSAVSIGVTMLIIALLFFKLDSQII